MEFLSGVRGGVGGDSFVGSASRSETKSCDLRNAFSDRRNRTALRRDEIRSSRYDVSRLLSWCEIPEVGSYVVV